MKYVLIGKIVNTHGLKGEVRILSDFKYKDRIFYINGIIDCLESNTILEIRAKEEK